MWRYTSEGPLALPFTISSKNSLSASFWAQVDLPASAFPRMQTLTGHEGSNGGPVCGYSAQT